MSNDLTIFGNTADLAALNDAFGESNIRESVSTPSLSYGGKQWTISLNGEKTVLTKTDDDGDEQPIKTFTGIVVAAAADRGRTYYKGNYDQDNPAPPDCWSDDGKKPDPSVDTPMASACAECPMSIKGSKVDDNGKESTACKLHKMLAIIPAGKLTHPPLRLKLSITSLYDGNMPDLEAKGWFAFDNYTKFLRSKGIKHTAGVVTKLTFDPNVVYPKVVFKAVRALTPEELTTVVQIAKSDEAKSLIAGKWTPAGTDGKLIEAKALPPKVEAKKPEPKKEAPKTIDLDEDEFVEVKPAKKEAAPKAKPKAPPAAKPEAVSTEVPDELAAILGEWGE